MDLILDALFGGALALSPLIIVVTVEARRQRRRMQGAGCWVGFWAARDVPPASLVPDGRRPNRRGLAPARTGARRDESRRQDAEARRPLAPRRRDAARNARGRRCDRALVSRLS